MPSLGKGVFAQGGGWNLPSTSRANTASRYWPHRAATVTSPICKLGSTPPAMPLTTMLVTSKRSSASCMFMVAFTMLTPLRNSTTLRPDRVPVTNSTPFTE